MDYGILGLILSVALFVVVLRVVITNQRYIRETEKRIKHLH